MAKGLEKEYYKHSEAEFSKLLSEIRNNPLTVHFFRDSSTPFFFLPDRKTNALFLQLHHDQWEYDALFDRLSPFGRNQVVQSFLIQEIESTNAIENIASTRHDIFALLQNTKHSPDRRLRSIVNGYYVLLENRTKIPTDLKDLRNLYERLLKGAIEAKDKPDGAFFRREPVFLTNGMKRVHQGFWPEEAINEGMREFLSVYNNQEQDLFERLILSHFLFETIHPFYDGNGRFGRFLLTLKYYAETGSYLSFAVSSALNERKSSYYRALKEAHHEHMYGSLNAFAEELAEIIHLHNLEVIGDLKQNIKRIDATRFSAEEFTPHERRILKLLAESSLLSEFGISNAEIMEATGISKRTVLSSMEKFRERNLLEEHKFSRTIFHRLREMPD